MSAWTLPCIQIDVCILIHPHLVQVMLELWYTFGLDSLKAVASPVSHIVDFARSAIMLRLTIVSPPVCQICVVPKLGGFAWTFCQVQAET